jgi:hypothetical protein
MPKHKNWFKQRGDKQQSTQSQLKSIPIIPKADDSIGLPIYERFMKKDASEGVTRPSSITRARPIPRGESPNFFGTLKRESLSSSNSDDSKTLKAVESQPIENAYTPSVGTPTGDSFARKEIPEGGDFMYDRVTTILDDAKKGIAKAKSGDRSKEEKNNKFGVIKAQLIDDIAKGCNYTLTKVDLERQSEKCKAQGITFKGTKELFYLTPQQRDALPKFATPIAEAFIKTITQFDENHGFARISYGVARNKIIDLYSTMDKQRLLIREDELAEKSPTESMSQGGDKSSTNLRASTLLEKHADAKTKPNVIITTINPQGIKGSNEGHTKALLGALRTAATTASKKVRSEVKNLKIMTR